VSIIIRILINAAALWVAVALLDGFNYDFATHGWLAFLGLALLLGVVNLVVRPILQFLTLPAILLSLGLFLLVINAITLAIVVALAGPLDLGLTSANFGWTFLAALIVSLVSWGLETLVGKS